MLQSNIGLVDRTFRIMVGVILLTAFILYPDSTFRYWALIGIYPLVTALVGTCPIFSFLGISTEIENFDY